MAKYKKTAYYLDDGILIRGYIDKYGFHPNKAVQCGFDLQKFNKHDIGKFIFPISAKEKKYEK